MRLSVRRALAWFLGVVLFFAARPLYAETIDAAARGERHGDPFEGVLDEPPPYFRIESVRVRSTAFVQDGRGLQSRATSNPYGRGDERATVFEPQAEIVVRQGERIKHRVWIPVDVVTAASTDAVDTVTSASRQNEAASIDWTASYEEDARTTHFLRNGVHLEEPFYSFNTGIGTVQKFAEDNFTLSANGNAIFDWFDRYNFEGKRIGRGARSTINANVGATQLLSPTTILHLNYGLTVQHGELGNTWNTVPLRPGAILFQNSFSSITNGSRILEKYPDDRWRHAAVARLVQWLPWNGAAKLSYRRYTDTWDLDAHTTTAELHQRVLPWLRANGLARWHRQSAVGFFTSQANDPKAYRSADSDLEELDAWSFGGGLAIEPRIAGTRSVLVEAAFEHYRRDNGLVANIVTWGASVFF